MVSLKVAFCHTSYEKTAGFNSAVDIAVIRELEADLYESSVVPLVLAYKHTSIIGLHLDGKVLDILTTDTFR